MLNKYWLTVYPHSNRSLNFKTKKRYLKFSKSCPHRRHMMFRLICWAKHTIHQRIALNWNCNLHANKLEIEAMYLPLQSHTSNKWQATHGPWSSAGLKMPIHAQFYWPTIWTRKVGQGDLVLMCEPVRARFEVSVYRVRTCTTLVVPKFDSYILTLLWQWNNEK